MATSFLLTDMATEVAKAIGGAGTQANLDLATTAIKAAIEDWNSAKEWNFLLRDTGPGYSVSGLTATQGSAVVNVVTAGTFDFINTGVTVTVGSGTATLAAGTTVLSITRTTSTGNVSAITLSNAFGGTTATLSETLNFTGDIPTVIGQNEYNLPPDFNSPYAARTTVNKRLLEYIKYREWNKKIVNQDINGTVEAYTIWNPISPLTQNFRTYRMRLFRTPAIVENIHLQYFRRMLSSATTVDIPDNYVYMLIDYAIWRLVRLKNTEDSRLPHLYEVAMKSLKMAMVDDDENSDDETFRLISQMESWNGERTLWTNGQFYANQLDY